MRAEDKKPMNLSDGEGQNYQNGSFDSLRGMDVPDDGLPDTLEDLTGSLPPLAPEVIEHVLRRGHKMFIAGPSKAGKSFALIELAICIAEGLPWMGFKCAQGKVMYVNLELDRASCLHRFRDVRQAMGAPSQHGVSIWNLRGHSVPMDKLAPKLIRRAAKQSYIAIIIDPIYKVITGDENSADQMAAFCNQFDKVCTELGCAVIYCHHHSKGAQGGKRSMDRASGSGVFARDPDALLDMIELELTDELREQRKNNAVGQLCGQWLKRYDQLDKVGQDDLCSRRAALDACADYLPTRAYNELLAEVEQTEQRTDAVTGWRIEGTLREFPKFPALNIWFEYPVHKVDFSGVLGDLNPDEDLPSWKRAIKARKTPEEKKTNRKEAIETAFNLCADESGSVEIADLISYFNDEKSERTIRNWVKEHGGFCVKNNQVTRKTEGK